MRSYHKALWEKPLPNGAFFGLSDKAPGIYLLHRSRLGEFHLTSDSVIPTFTKSRRLIDIINEIPEIQRSTFRYISYTIGGMMIFPGNRIDNKRTLNGERGCHPRIKDRFDLTLECIRRHYVNEPSPIGTVRFFTPFTSFDQSPLPHTIELYMEYKRLTIRFLEARAGRIAQQALMTYG